MKDQEAVQKFFLEEVQKGEEYLGRNDFDNCVKHLTNAIAVCGQPQQLLQVFKQTLPPNVFQMLIQNLALLGSAQMQQMVFFSILFCFVFVFTKSYITWMGNKKIEHVIFLQLFLLKWKWEWMEYKMERYFS